MNLVVLTFLALIFPGPVGQEIQDGDVMELPISFSKPQFFYHKSSNAPEEQAENHGQSESATSFIGGLVSGVGCVILSNAGGIWVNQMKDGKRFFHHIPYCIEQFAAKVIFKIFGGIGMFAAISYFGLVSVGLGSLLGIFALTLCVKAGFGEAVKIGCEFITCFAGMIVLGSTIIILTTLGEPADMFTITKFQADLFTIMLVPIVILNVMTILLSFVVKIYGSSIFTEDVYYQDVIEIISGYLPVPSATSHLKIGVAYIFNCASSGECLSLATHGWIFILLGAGFLLDHMLTVCKFEPKGNCGLQWFMGPSLNLLGSGVYGYFWFNQWHNVSWGLLITIFTAHLLVIPLQLAGIVFDKKVRSIRLEGSISSLNEAFVYMGTLIGVKRSGGCCSQANDVKEEEIPGIQLESLHTVVPVVGHQTDREEQMRLRSPTPSGFSDVSSVQL